MRNTKRGARDGRKLVRTGALVLVLLLLAFCYTPPGRAMWTELRRVCGLLPFAQSLPDADLTVYVINVGKADAAQFFLDDQRFLVDTGTKDSYDQLERVLEAYGVTTVNYNRDIEIFPVVNAMFELIAGKSPYKSPTDMGVNMAGNCIVDDAVCREASRKEILRRYFKCLCEQKITGTVKETERYKLELLLNQADLTVGQREVEKQAHARSESTGGAPAAAIELPDGTVVTGKTGPLLGAASSALLNALKKLAGIDQELDLVSAAAIEPIQTLKTNYLGGKNPRLHTDEILIALSSSAADNEQAAAAMHQLPNLKGCDVHSTVLLSSVDTSTLNRLGMYLTCDPVYEEEDRKYHKQ